MLFCVTCMGIHIKRIDAYFTWQIVRDVSFALLLVLIFLIYIFFAMGSAESLLQSNGKVQAHKSYSTKLVGMPHTNIR